MYARLNNVDARKINERLNTAHAEGSAATGQVLTLIVVTDTVNAPIVSANAMEAGRLHPSRVILLIRDGKSEVAENTTGIDAEIRSGESIPGDMITLWLAGEVERHPASIVVPLLLPQLPVVVWTPSSDESLLDDLEGLSKRLIIDTSHSENGTAEVHEFARLHKHGQTDISWTRLTRWRSLICSLLDQIQEIPTSATVTAPQNYAPAEYLAQWLKFKLGIPVEIKVSSSGEGINSVVLESSHGPLEVRRTAGTHGMICLPNQPERPVALAWLAEEELIGEELVRLNGDEMFDALMKFIRENDESNESAASLS